MPKLKPRQRKTPVTNNPTVKHTSSSSKSTRTTIRQYHNLLKQRARLLSKSLDDNIQRALVGIDQELNELGGLDAYQRMSTIGQDIIRGGGCEKVFITWLRELGLAKHSADQKLRLLEVGALKPDNYRSCFSWLECTPIDLQSRHPSIKEQDFLLLDEEQYREHWDLVSTKAARVYALNIFLGKMLKLAYDILKPDGYLDFERMKRIMQAIGFTLRKERWKKEGKMVYWLFQKGSQPLKVDETLQRKVVLRQGNRNNFCILLL